MKPNLPPGCCVPHIIAHHYLSFGTDGGLKDGHSSSSSVSPPCHTNPVNKDFVKEKKSLVAEEEEKGAGPTSSRRRSTSPPGYSVEFHPHSPWSTSSSSSLTPKISGAPQLVVMSGGMGWTRVCATIILRDIHQAGVVAATGLRASSATAIAKEREGYMESHSTRPCTPPPCASTPAFLRGGETGEQWGMGAPLLFLVTLPDGVPNDVLRSMALCLEGSLWEEQQEHSYVRSTAARSSVETTVPVRAQVLVEGMNTKERAGVYERGGVVVGTGRIFCADILHRRLCPSFIRASLFLLPKDLTTLTCKSRATHAAGSLSCSSSSWWGRVRGRGIAPVSFPSRWAEDVAEAPRWRRSETFSFAFLINMIRDPPASFSSLFTTSFDEATAVPDDRGDPIWMGRGGEGETTTAAASPSGPSWTENTWERATSTSSFTRLLVLSDDPIGMQYLVQRHQKGFPRFLSQLGIEEVHLFPRFRLEVMKFYEDLRRCRTPPLHQCSGRSHSTASSVQHPPPPHDAVAGGRIRVDRITVAASTATQIVDQLLEKILREIGSEIQQTAQGIRRQQEQQEQKRRAAQGEGGVTQESPQERRNGVACRGRGSRRGSLPLSMRPEGGADETKGTSMAMYPHGSSRAVRQQTRILLDEEERRSAANQSVPLSQPIPSLSSSSSSSSSSSVLTSIRKPWRDAASPLEIQFHLLTPELAANIAEWELDEDLSNALFTHARMTTPTNSNPTPIGGGSGRHREVEAHGERGEGMGSSWPYKDLVYSLLDVRQLRRDLHTGSPYDFLWSLQQALSFPRKKPKGGGVARHGLPLISHSSPTPLWTLSSSFFDVVTVSTERVGTVVRLDCPTKEVTEEVAPCKEHLTVPPFPDGKPETIPEGKDATTAAPVAYRFLPHPIHAVDPVQEVLVTMIHSWCRGRRRGRERDLRRTHATSTAVPQTPKTTPIKEVLLVICFGVDGVLRTVQRLLYGKTNFHQLLLNRFLMQYQRLHQHSSAQPPPPPSACTVSSTTTGSGTGHLTAFPSSPTPLETGTNSLSPEGKAAERNAAEEESAPSTTTTTTPLPSTAASTSSSPSWREVLWFEDGTGMSEERKMLLEKTTAKPQEEKSREHQRKEEEEEDPEQDAYTEERLMKFAMLFSQRKDPAAEDGDEKEDEVEVKKKTASARKKKNAKGSWRTGNATLQRKKRSREGEDASNEDDDEEEEELEVTPLFSQRCATAITLQEHDALLRGTTSAPSMANTAAPSQGMPSLHDILVSQPLAPLPPPPSLSTAPSPLLSFGDPSAAVDSDDEDHDEGVPEQKSNTTSMVIIVGDDEEEAKEGKKDPQRTAREQKRLKRTPSNGTTNVPEEVVKKEHPVRCVPSRDAASILESSSQKIQKKEVQKDICFISLEEEAEEEEVILLDANDLDQHHTIRVEKNQRGEGALAISTIKEPQMEDEEGEEVEIQTMPFYSKQAVPSTPPAGETSTSTNHLMHCHITPPPPLLQAEQFDLVEWSSSCVMLESVGPPSSSSSFIMLLQGDQLDERSLRDWIHETHPFFSTNSAPPSPPRKKDIILTRPDLTVLRQIETILHDPHASRSTSSPVSSTRIRLLVTSFTEKSFQHRVKAEREAFLSLGHSKAMLTGTLFMSRAARQAAELELASGLVLSRRRAARGAAQFVDRFQVFPSHGEDRVRLRGEIPEENSTWKQHPGKRGANSMREEEDDDNEEEDTRRGRGEGKRMTDFMGRSRGTRGLSSSLLKPPSAMVPVGNGNTGGGLTTSSTSSPFLVVLFDDREFRCHLPYALHAAGMEVIPLTLRIADYILSPEVAVERKSIPDLLQSLLHTGRLVKQLTALSNTYSTPICLIEGTFGEPYRLVLPPSSSSWSTSSATGSTSRMSSSANREGEVHLSFSHQVYYRLGKLYGTFLSLSIWWTKNALHTAALFRQMKCTVARVNPSPLDPALTMSLVALQEEEEDVVVSRVELPFGGERRAYQGVKRKGCEARAAGSTRTPRTPLWRGEVTDRPSPVSALLMSGTRDESQSEVVPHDVSRKGTIAVVEVEEEENGPPHISPRKARKTEEEGAPLTTRRKEDTGASTTAIPNGPSSPLPHRQPPPGEHCVAAAPLPVASAGTRKPSATTTHPLSTMAAHMLLRFPGITPRNAAGVMRLAGSLLGLSTVAKESLWEVMSEEEADKLYSFLHASLVEG